MLNSITMDLKHYAKDLSILIAEDDLDIASEMKDILTMFFKDVYVAHDGVEALNLYKQYNCDLVLTDLEMPKMGGVELAKQIRTLSKDQTIFVNSAYIDKYVVELFDIGIQGLFIKPFKTSEFFQKILVHCENIKLKKEMNKYKTLISKMARKIEEPKQTKPKVTLKSILSDESINLDSFINDFGNNYEFDHDFWNFVSSDVVELNGDLEEVINRISLRGLNKDSIDDLALIFSKYNNILLLIPHMNNMANVFKNMCETFEDLDLNTQFTCSHEEIAHTLEYFYDDIMNFFEVVFVEKSTDNINYLTDSLDSSLVQLKTKLGLIELEEEDLELF